MIYLFPHVNGESIFFNCSFNDEHINLGIVIEYFLFYLFFDFFKWASVTYAWF